MTLRKTEQPSQRWFLTKATEKKLHTRRKNRLEPLTSICNFGCGGFEFLFRSDGRRRPLVSNRGGQPW